MRFRDLTGTARSQNASNIISGARATMTARLAITSCIIVATCVSLSGCFVWSDQPETNVLAVHNDTDRMLGVQWQGGSPDYELEAGSGAEIVRTCEKDTLVVSLPNGEEFARLTDDQLCRATVIVIRGEDDVIIEERE